MPQGSGLSSHSASLPHSIQENQVLDRLLSSWYDWVSSAFEQLGHWIIVFGIGFILFLAAYFLARQLSNRLSGLLCQKIDETFGKFLAKLIFYGTLALAALVVLPSFGIQLSGVVAVFASAAFAIGLALQGTLSNISAGLLLLLLRPFKVGDLVQLNGITGKVNEIDLFTTTLDTFDNRRLILPNASITSSTIENISFHGDRRVDITLRIEYSAGLEATRTALSEAVEAVGERIVPGERRGYKIVLANFGDSAVEWTLRVWVRQDDFFQAREDLLVEVKRALDRAAISIPYPQLHVQMSSVKAIASRTANSPQKTDPAGQKENLETPEETEYPRLPIRPRAREKASKEKTFGHRDMGH